MSITAACCSFEMSDSNDITTIEEVFKKWASFAGVQSFSFDDQIKNFEASKWTTITHVAYGDTLARTGTIASDTITWFADDMPHSYMVEFTVHQPKWCILLRGVPGLGTYYKLEYDQPGALVTVSLVTASSTIVFIKKVLTGQELVTWGKVRIMVRDQWGTADSGEISQYLSLFVNDINIVTAAANLEGGGLGVKLGFMVYAGSAATLVSDLRVANLSDIEPTSSLDPAGSPISAIQLAVEDRYVRWWMRWDGSLRAWTPGKRANSLTIPRSRQYTLQLQTDVRQLYTHIRILGAFAWVQLKDDTMIQWYGNRFAEIQNSSAWFADDCHRMGLQLLIRSKEAAFQAQFGTLGMALNEVEDRIQLPDITSSDAYFDYIIDNLNINYENGTLKVNGTGRRYFYGD